METESRELTKPLAKDLVAAGYKTFIIYEDSGETGTFLALVPSKDTLFEAKNVVRAGYLGEVEINDTVVNEMLSAKRTTFIINAPVSAISNTNQKF